MNFLFHLKSKNLVTLWKFNSHLQYYKIDLSFSIKLQQINLYLCEEYKPQRDIQTKRSATIESRVLRSAQTCMYGYFWKLKEYWFRFDRVWTEAITVCWSKVSNVWMSVLMQMCAYLNREVACVIITFRSGPSPLKKQHLRKDDKQCDARWNIAWAVKRKRQSLPASSLRGVCQLTRTVCLRDCTFSQA